MKAIEHKYQILTIESLYETEFLGKASWRRLGPENGSPVEVHGLDGVIRNPKCSEYMPHTHAHNARKSTEGQKP